MPACASNDAFHAETSDFLNWLRERPGTTISHKLQITDLRNHNSGRGVRKEPRVNALRFDAC